MTLVGISVLILLLTFVVPNITAVFADMDQVLPAPTLVLIAVSKFLKSYGWTILVGIILGLFIFRRIIKTSAGLRFYDKIQLVLPGFGQLIKKLTVTRFARTLGSLLENGIPMLPALEIVKNIVGNVLIGEAVENATRDVGKGQALHTSLAATNIFPHLSIQMIQVGENSGALETMLNKIADVYENEVETTVMSLTALLEPILIILMGIVIGFIVLSICLPIFEMNQLVL
jgi:general secretion pathway protein F